MSIKVTVIVQKEDNWYVAKCIENSVASQGKTIEESIYNLKEALELYYEDETPEATDIPTFITEASSRKLHPCQWVGMN